MMMFPGAGGVLDVIFAGTCIFLDVVLVVAVPFFLWVRKHGSVSPLTAVGVAIAIGIVADLARALVFADSDGGLIAHLQDLRLHPMDAAGILPFCIVAVPLVFWANRHIALIYDTPSAPTAS
jgi:hypothetical protein